ncbi:MAG: hypothetical protein K8L99_30535 [Anaerolineae bacterium]|nr:hypothetical protein [Anaerolineae bacterium]
MTKKNNNSSQSSPRSLLASLLAILILLVALIASGITGIDINEILDILGQPTLVVTTPPAVTVTSAPPETQPPSVTGTPPPVGTRVADGSNTVVEIAIPQGFGAAKSFWQVYFTAPTGSRDLSTYMGGIDNPLAAAIVAAQRTLDIAAFEFNDPLLTQVVLDAKQRGVVVRMVTDDEHGIEDDDSTVQQLIDAGIPVVPDNRSALMHNKFMIIDSEQVWTGSLNYTINGVYRNNNNLISLRSNRVVLSYQAEFDEMFLQKSFGVRSPRGNSVSFTEQGVPIQTVFAAEDDALNTVVDRVSEAQSSVRFMTFSFTERDIADALVERAANGVTVRGIFERVGSETTYSELTRLWCAGLDARQDGNPFILHHKVFIIDNRVVITGSLNFSENATTSNDENMIIIEDRDLARQYLGEFERRWAEAIRPDDLDCSILEE